MGSFGNLQDSKRIPHSTVLKEQVLGRVPELQTPPGWSLRASNPQLVQVGKRLRFDLALIAGDACLFTSLGWSVYRGRVYPPSFRTGTRYLKTSTWGHVDAEQYVYVLLRPWRELYPQVFGIVGKESK